VPNSYETIYGPIADDAATKYGIDTSMFRNLIRSESSFNPYAINPKSVNGENASGIAQFLPSTASSLNINPFDPNSALNGAAKYLRGLIDSLGVTDAIAKYKGYSDSNMTAGREVAAGIIGNLDSGITTDKPESGTIPQSSSVPDKAIWNYTFDDLKSAIKNGTLSLTIGFVGLLIIALSIWALFSKSAPTVIKTLPIPKG